MRYQHPLLSRLAQRFRSSWPILGAYIGISVVLLELADQVTEHFLLPNVVYVGLFAVLVAGLPILTATAALQGQFFKPPEGPLDPTLLPPELAQDRRFTTLRRWFTWRNAARGGVMAISLWLGVTAASIVLDARAETRFTGPVTDLVVVAPFENLTGEPKIDRLGRVAALVIERTLSRSGVGRVVSTLETSRTSAALRSAGFALSGDGLHRLAERTNAGIILSGEYYAEGDSIHFSSRLTDASDGELLAAVRPVGSSAEEIMSALTALSQSVVGALATVLDEELFDFGLATPPSLSIYQDYTRAIDIFLQGRWQESAELLLATYEGDSTFVPALFLAQVAYWNMGEYAGHDSIVQILAEKHQHLPPALQSSVDAMMAKRRGNWSAALRHYRRALELSPTPASHWGNGVNHMLGNHPGKAAEILGRLNPESIPGWWPYWRWRTAAHHMLGNHRRELKIARAGREEYPQLLATLEYEARALVALGRVDDVRERLDESLTLPLHDWSLSKLWSGYTAGEVMETAAVELLVHERPEAAREVFKRAIDWFEQRSPDEKETFSHRHTFARVLYAAGDYRRARELFLEVADEHPDVVHFPGYLGAIAARLDDNSTALEYDEKLIAFANPQPRGANTYWRACIAALRGERDSAVRLLQKAFNEGHPYSFTLQYPKWDNVQHDLDLLALKGYEPFEALMRPKG